MPVLDGFGVLEKLPKEHHPYPVLLLTNSDYQAHRERGKMLVADGYVTKVNTMLAAFIETVVRLLRQG